MVVFEKPKALTDTPFHYCPGCTHGIVHRLVAEAIEELGIEGRTIGVGPCRLRSVCLQLFCLRYDRGRAWRAPAVATGLKRADGSKIVFTYQGDGDLASIGTAETGSFGRQRGKYHNYLYQ